ncbi:MAG: MAPEG family protein [Pacificimonas sp.]
MHIVTMTVAGLLGLIFLALSARVVGARLAGKHLIGDGGDETMLYRIRAHANFAEYVPICLILMGLIEMATGPRTGLWVLGGLLVIARILHAWGMNTPTENKPRVFGILLTWIILIALSLWALLLAFAVVN